MNLSLKYNYVIENLALCKIWTILNEQYKKNQKNKSDNYLKGSNRNTITYSYVKLIKRSFINTLA